MPWPWCGGSASPTSSSLSPATPSGRRSRKRCCRDRERHTAPTSSAACSTYVKLRAILRDIIQDHVLGDVQVGDMTMPVIRTSIAVGNTIARAEPTIYCRHMVARAEATIYCRYMVMTMPLHRLQAYSGVVRLGVSHYRQSQLRKRRIGRSRWTCRPSQV